MEATPDCPEYPGTAEDKELCKEALSRAQGLGINDNNIVTNTFAAYNVKHVTLIDFVGAPEPGNNPA